MPKQWILMAKTKLGVANIWIGFWIVFCFALHGCQFEECKTDKQYADKPGICGKIYRTEQSKKVFNQKSMPKIYLILAFMLMPLLVLVLLRIMRFFLLQMFDLMTRIIRTRRDDFW